MSNKTPSYTLDAVKNYNAKLVAHRFQAKNDSERGKLLTQAKNDEQFVDKFWLWLEKEYKHYLD